ncbi:MAG: hypothetical protein Ct9H300mP11_14310 [Chloroflexota bacterium]|nr:MAG: hypothetical protein Ct9H300mP11_14310 [Chloroflexota bacterium]
MRTKTQGDVREDRVLFQTIGESQNPQQVLEFGPLAENLGFDSIWVMDHLFNTGYIRERPEDRPYYHLCLLYPT